MAVDLELIPYTGKRWPKKATLIRYGREFHIRNWTVLFEILMTMPKASLPENMAVVRPSDGEEFISCDSPLSGQQLEYVSAAKVTSALKKAIKEWKPIDPASEWAKEDAESYKKMNKILGVMKKLRPSTPVILYWS